VSDTNPKSCQNVLVIDDDQIVLQILAKILRREGYNVDTAETGREALEKLQNKIYHIAIIDVRLQDINGIDLLAQIQKTVPNMKKIMLTGYPSNEDKTRALELGANEYLAKPVKSEELIAAIECELQQDPNRNKGTNGGCTKQSYSMNTLGHL
jgi:DNA-binding response OmpR family regulator